MGRWFFRTGEWMVARFANDVICVSSNIEEGLSARYPPGRERFVTIRNGAPPPSTRPAAETDILSVLGLAPGGYILAVGRIDPAKGFHDLVQAFERARPTGLKLVIAGGAPANDPYGAKLKQSASDRIVFAGVQPADRLRTLYENAALFVHPSYHEGCPIVVLEALAADAPILVSDIPAHREVGLDPAAFFKAKDADGLAVRLAEGNFERLRCQRRLKILQENDWDTVARRHHDIIVRRLPGRPAHAAASDASAPAP